MKPINNDLRKQAFTRAGFFTLVPMLLVGILVWSGMRNVEENESSKNEELVKMKSNLEQVKKPITKIVFLQDTLTKMFEKKRDLEEKYKEAFLQDPSLISDEKAALEKSEENIEDFLKSQDEKNDSILGPILNQYDVELRLSKKIWRDCLSDLGDDEVVEELKKELKNYKEELDDLRRKDASSSNSLQNKISQLEGVNANLNSSQGKIKNIILTHLNQMKNSNNSLALMINDIKKNMVEAGDEKLSKEEWRTIYEQTMNIIRTNGDVRSKLDYLENKVAEF